MGGIGETITVGTSVFGERGGFIVDNDSYMPAKDHLVSAYLFPIGDLNILIGMTAEALGLHGGSKFFPPAILPVEDGFDAGLGSDLAHTYVGADQDLINAVRQADDATVRNRGTVNAEYHYVGMIET